MTRKEELKPIIVELRKDIGRKGDNIEKTWHLDDNTFGDLTDINALQKTIDELKTYSKEYDTLR